VDRLINFITGEILDFGSMTDEEIVEQIKDLEDAYAMANLTLKVAKAALIERMQKEGATLKLTPMGQVRLKATNRVVNKELVEALHRECPEPMKKKCFAFDIRPLKNGLNELAKLGSDWKAKVDTIYETTYSLGIEWANEIPTTASSEIAASDECPF